MTAKRKDSCEEFWEASGVYGWEGVGLLMWIFVLLAASYVSRGEISHLE